MTTSASGPVQTRRLLAAALVLLALLTLTLFADGALPAPSVSAAPTGPTINALDFPSIQDALDSLETSGGAVRIPAGTYLLPEKVRVYSNITVFGDGMDETILRFAPGIEDHMMSNASLSKGNTNITVRDLTLQGRKTTKSDCCFGLRLVNVSNVTVINVASDGFSKDGFYLGYYRQLGVYNSRLSGCRARDNGRNGISLTHGSGNIIDHCLVEDNNRSERVAGIDLEPDETLSVTDNKVVNNTTNGQNVGIQLYAFDRNRVTIANNAVCYNTAKQNTSAGIWDHNTSGDIFVDNVTSGNGTNFSVDKSAKIGKQYASACELPALPGQPGTPTPTATATGVPGTPTATATRTATPTATPDTRTLSVEEHNLTATALVKNKATLTSTVEIQNGSGQPVRNAQVTIRFTGPNTQKNIKAKTDSSGRATVKLKVKLAGEYQAEVTGITLKGSTFTSGPEDQQGPVTVR